jgi:hypothetical protein
VLGATILAIQKHITGCASRRGAILTQLTKIRRVFWDEAIAALSRVGVQQGRILRGLTLWVGDVLEKQVEHTAIDGLALIIAILCRFTARSETSRTQATGLAQHGRGCPSDKEKGSEELHHLVVDLTNLEGLELWV